MVSLTRLLSVLMALSVQGTNAYFPTTWTGFFTPLPFLVATKWGNRGTQVVTAGQGAWVHIYDCIKNCRDSEGNPRDKLECANAIIQSGFGFGLAVLSYQTVGTWTKRDTINADAILNLLPDSVKITDIKLFGEAIVTNRSSPAFRRRELHADEPLINVAYNGSMPFTFVMHHQIHNESVAVPMFITTNGQGAEIYHIAPTPTNSTGSSLDTRSEISPWYDATVGGMYIEANSDPTCYYYDVVNWLTNSQTGGYSEQMADFILISMDFAVMGHAFDYKVNGYLDGQFNMTGFTTPVPRTWTTGYNWCFGVNPTNC